MAKAIPHTMLIWVQSNEWNKDIVVLIETVAVTLKVGETKWSDKLDRFGTVEFVGPNDTRIRVN